MDRVMAQLGLNGVDEIGPHIFWNPPDWVSRRKTTPALEDISARAAGG